MQDWCNVRDKYENMEDWRRPQKGPNAKRQRLDPDAAHWDLVKYLVLGLGCNAPIVDALAGSCPALFISSLITRLRFVELPILQKKLEPVIAASRHPPWMQRRLGVCLDVSLKDHCYTRRDGRGAECLGVWFFNNLNVYVGHLNLRIAIESTLNANGHSLAISLHGTPCKGIYIINSSEYRDRVAGFTGKLPNQQMTLAEVADVVWNALEQQ